ncbi:MAG: tRNA lysidine(34) synthetase TilS [Bacteroidota bacterium]
MKLKYLCRQMVNERSLEKVIQLNLKELLSSKFLLAVSGGIDSMVLLYLFKKLQIHFEVAHCNFCLRGEESDHDFLFVKTACAQNNIIFHGKKFNTLDYSKQQGISIQMAARDLRYQWFNEIMQSSSLPYLATAHHENDQTETVLLNVFRGKGHYTWEGMSIQNNTIIRPLLNTSKGTILNFARENSIKWREDSSNEKSDYQRNYLRNKLLPDLGKNFPSVENKMIQFAAINQYNNHILRSYFSNKAKEICFNQGENFVLKKDKLLSDTLPYMLLYQFIQSYGFNIENCQQIIQTIHNSGKKFYSRNYVALIDRDRIIIQKNKLRESHSVFINYQDKQATFNHWHFTFTPMVNQQIQLKTNLKSVAFIDQSLLDGQLEIRTIREGDFFHPLGMKGKKLVSDFFIDEKINDFEKQEIPLLCFDGKIIWIAGHRIDDRFKVTENTSAILRIEVTQTT